MASPGSGGGRQDANRRGPLERPRHPKGRNAVKEPGAARLAGDASGPSRERRPLPRHRERPQTAPPRERRPQHVPAVKPPPTKDGPPAGAGGRAVQGRASQGQGGTCRRPCDAGRTARPRGPECLRGRHQAPHPVRARRSRPAVCVRQPRSIRSADADPRQPIVTARPRPGIGARGREARLRAIERGRAASPARGATDAGQARREMTAQAPLGSDEPNLVSGRTHRRHEGRRRDRRALRHHLCPWR